MRDEEVERYLEDLALEAYPELTRDHVLVTIEGGKIDAGDTRRPGPMGNSACRETVGVSVTVSAPERVDRHELLRRASLRRVESKSGAFLLAATGFHYHDGIVVVGMKSTQFLFSITQDVF